MGGYPFPFFSYDLQYWVGALFYFLFPISLLTAQKIYLFVGHLLVLIIPISLANSNWQKFLIGAAIFSSLPLVQLNTYGMSGYLYGFALFYLLVSYPNCTPILFLLSLAHPFAFFAGLLLTLFRIFAIQGNRKKAAATFFLSLMFAFPRLYALWISRGWLHV